MTPNSGLPCVPSPVEENGQNHILHGKELVRVLTGNGVGGVKVEAKFDSGAATCSIDTRLANQLGLRVVPDKWICVKQQPLGSAVEPLCPEKRRRPVVEMTVILYGRSYDVTASVAARSHMSTQLLLGENLLELARQDACCPNCGGSIWS